MGTEKNESYKNTQLVEADGTGVINLVKKRGANRLFWPAGQSGHSGRRFRLGADGALTVGNSFSTSSGGLLDIAAGAALALDYHEAASRLGNELAVRRNACLQQGTGSGCGRNVSTGFFRAICGEAPADGNHAESGIQSGESRKLVSVTEGNTLSFADAVRQERKVRYATGRNADSGWIYRELDVYSGLTLNVQGEANGRCS